jgi:hypothetical protein
VPEMARMTKTFPHFAIFTPSAMVKMTKNFCNFRHGENQFFFTSGDDNPHILELKKILLSATTFMQTVPALSLSVRSPHVAESSSPGLTS